MEGDHASRGDTPMKNAPRYRYAYKSFELLQVFSCTRRPKCSKSPLPVMEKIHGDSSRDSPGQSGAITHCSIHGCRSRGSPGTNDFSTGWSTLYRRSCSNSSEAVVNGSISSRSCREFSVSSSPSSHLLTRRRLRGFGQAHSSIKWCFLSSIVWIACVLRPAFALVIEEPFHAVFEHVPAAFGPDALQIDPPLEHRPLVKARPREACSPLSSTIEKGGIALVERGNCNFTQKVLHAQEAGASAVVVTDTRVMAENWLMIMYGEPESTQGIEIPAVLVSREAGELLWNTRSWLGNGKIRVSINLSGHIVMRPVAISALETLGIYILLLMLLLAFSGICCLVFALGFTWYQKGARERAMRKLKSFSYHRPVLAPDVGHDGAAGDVSGVNSRQQRGRSGTNGIQEDDTCVICLDAYEEGDKITTLPCGHLFHSRCIMLWFSGNNGLCPICKRDAFPPGVILWMPVRRVEAAFADLARLGTDNLAVLGLFFVASVACGLVAAM